MTVRARDCAKPKARRSMQWTPPKKLGVFRVGLHISTPPTPMAPMAQRTSGNGIGGSSTASPPISLVLAPEYQLPPPVRKPEDMHPLPTGIDAYFVYPFTAEDVVASGQLNTSSRSVAALREKHDTYLATRKATKEREAQERIRRMAPGWVPDQVLQPTPAQRPAPPSRDGPSPTALDEHARPPAPTPLSAAVGHAASVADPGAGPSRNSLDSRAPMATPSSSVPPVRLEPAASTEERVATTHSTAASENVPVADLQELRLPRAPSPAPAALAEPLAQPEDTVPPTTPPKSPVERPAAPTPLSASDPASHLPNKPTDDAGLEQLTSNMNAL